MLFSSLEVFINIKKDKKELSLFSQKLLFLLSFLRVGLIFPAPFARSKSWLCCAAATGNCRHISLSSSSLSLSLSLSCFSFLLFFLASLSLPLLSLPQSFSPLSLPQFLSLCFLLSSVFLSSSVSLSLSVSLSPSVSLSLSLSLSPSSLFRLGRKTNLA